ncbi:hypothetical protein M5D96_003346, partial [Drosophila gunungcola]
IVVHSNKLPKSIILLHPNSYRLRASLPFFRLTQYPKWTYLPFECERVSLVNISRIELSCKCGISVFEVDRPRKLQRTSRLRH